MRLVRRRKKKTEKNQSLTMTSIKKGQKVKLTLLMHMVKKILLQTVRKMLRLLQIVRRVINKVNMSNNKLRKVIRISSSLLKHQSKTKKSKTEKVKNLSPKSLLLWTWHLKHLKVKQFQK